MSSFQKVNFVIELASDSYRVVELINFRVWEMGIIK